MLKWLFGGGKKRLREPPTESPVLLPSTIDWSEAGTLTHALGYDIRTDPLWILVMTAIHGHEGRVEEMTISMKSGLTYGPAEIRALALRPDRQRASE